MVGCVASSNLTLDCEVVKGHPKPSLSWWGECKQRGRIFLKLEPLGENLIYEYVICIIFYNWTSMFNVYSVPKLIPHKFFFHKCLLHVFYSTACRHRVLLPSGVRVPLIDHTHFVTHANGSLTILNVSDMDSGPYACLAWNRVGSDLAYTHLYNTHPGNDLLPTLVKCEL